MKVEVASEDKVDFAAKQLLAAIEDGNISKVSLRQKTLRKIKDVISKARSAGFSHSRIAMSLTSNGVQVTRYDVARFCIESLGEAKPKKRRKKKGEEPQSSKELKRDELTVSRLSQSAPSSSTLRNGNQSRPGFRVARDEDL